MSTGTDNGASAPAPSGKGPRIHRAVKAQAVGPRKILVVDDDKIVLATTAAKLKAAGYEVLTAEDGGSAIRQARQLQPDVILLDLNFPPDVGHGGGIPWDGFLILSWLRRTVETEKIPAIVITAGDLEKHKDRLQEAGVRDVFLKPIDHEALLSAIRWALVAEVAEPAPTPVEPSSQPPTQPPGPPPPKPSPVIEDPNRPKILFVDDTSDWRYLATSYVGERGYNVVTAEDPVSAMLQVSDFKPNLVVLDLNLAGQSAVALLRLLSERHPETPVLIHSGMELGQAEVSELLKQGARAWLPKGSMEELVAAIEKTLSDPEPTVVPRKTAKPSKKKTPKASPATAEFSGDTTARKTEVAPKGDEALLSLDGLRTGTTEELLTAVARAESVTPEQPQAAPEISAAVPNELIESAAGSILIVEDDAAFTDTLRSFLESHSFRVSSVSTGADAVCLLAVVDVDLILFDLTMPGFHVHEFFDAVKAVKPHLCPRIIFMTSDESHPKDDAFVRRLKGISLWKPFPMDWLLEAVQTLRGEPRQDQLAAK